MRILYFISVKGHGSGGHAYSLNHIATKSGEFNSVGIVSIGQGFSEVLQNNKYFKKHIYFNGINFVQLFKELKQINNDFRPEIIHFFDRHCYNALRIFYQSKRYKLILNKCGGPNLPRYPFIKNINVFSLENYYWLKKYSKFKSSNIYIIPNRVNAINIDVQKKIISKNKAHFNFLRICRITLAYKKSIYDSIRLIDLLHKKGYTNTRLIIIGVVQDLSLYNELLKLAIVQKGIITFYTSKEFTDEASQFLYLADTVVGVGRSFMEATSSGKPVLAINSEGDIPVLIDKKNFNDVFYTNFSQRNIFKSYDYQKNLEKIIELVTKSSFYQYHSNLAYEIFDQYFDLEKGIIKYNEMYQNAYFGGGSILRDIRIIAGSIKSFKTKTPQYRPPKINGNNIASI